MDDNFDDISNQSNEPLQGQVGLEDLYYEMSTKQKDEPILDNSPIDGQVSFDDLANATSNVEIEQKQPKTHDEDQKNDELSIIEENSNEDIDTIFADTENLPLSKEMVKINGTENLAQIFTQKRYKKADNIFMSKKLLKFLHDSDFMNNE